MGHGVQGRVTSPQRIDSNTAEVLATTLQALASPSRLMILSRLRHSPCAVSQLADEVDMEQSAVSHQLRLLRNLGLVTRTRSGRASIYALYDEHVTQLLDQAISHVEHLHLGVPDSVDRSA